MKPTIPETWLRLLTGRLEAPALMAVSTVDGSTPVDKPEDG